MKKTSKGKPREAMRPEYDFSGGVRGKYAKRFAEGTNVVFLAPDVATYFKSSESVNQTLRSLIEIAGKATGADH